MVSKKKHFCEWQTRKSVPRDHRLSSLGKLSLVVPMVIWPDWGLIFLSLTLIIESYILQQIIILVCTVGVLVYLCSEYSQENILGRHVDQENIVRSKVLKINTIANRTEHEVTHSAGSYLGLVYLCPESR